MDIARILQHGEFTAEQFQSMGMTIHESAERMFRLMKNILDENALESDKLRLNLLPIDVIMTARDTAQSFALQSEVKNIYIVVEEPAKALPKVLGDTSAVGQVLENLLSNAVKYSPFGKSVTIFCKNNEGSVKICVREEGLGLTDDDKDQLFLKFERLSAQPTAGGHSTGLGLSIVKKLIAAMNGMVWCESEFGKGATFVVELPAVDGVKTRI